MLSFKKVSFILVLPLCFLSTGCRDDSLLKAVRDFTKSRETASKTVMVISEDFYKSCVRQYEFLPIEPVPTVINKKTPYQDRIEGLKNCKEQWKIGDNFEKANELLIKYMATLEALASDDVVIFPDTTKEKLENAINNLPFGDESNEATEIKAERQQSVKAGVGILQFLSKLYLNQLRKERLVSAITETNNDIQTYTQTLKIVVERGYIDGYLVQELDNINLYYNLFVTDILREAFPEVQADQPPKKLALPLNPFISLDDDWRTKRAEVEDKVELGRLYINFLDEVAQGHNELYTLIKGKQQNSLTENKSNSVSLSKIKQLSKNRLERIQKITKELDKKL